MSDPTAPKSTGPVMFEARLTRIELLTDVPSSEEAAERLLRWEVSVYGIDLAAEEAVLLVGHLVSRTGDIWGQAQVQGVLRRDKPFPSEAARRAFVKKYAGGFTEELYDTARRSLNVNAALIDIDLELPIAAPEEDIGYLPAESFGHAPGCPRAHEEAAYGGEGHYEGE